MANNSSIFLEKDHGQRSLAGYSPVAKSRTQLSDYTRLCIIFIMSTNFLAHKYRQGIMGTVYLCSVMSEVLVKYSKPGGENHRKAHSLTHESSRWLLSEGPWFLSTQATPCGLCMDYPGLSHSIVSELQGQAFPRERCRQKLCPLFLI